MAPEVKEGFIHVEGKLYDTDNLAKLHPGGQMFIKVTYDGIYLVETLSTFFVKIWILGLPGNLG